MQELALSSSVRSNKKSTADVERFFRTAALEISKLKRSKSSRILRQDIKDASEPLAAILAQLVSEARERTVKPDVHENLQPDYFRQARVTWWNENELSVLCPYCRNAHTHKFVGGYTSVIRFPPCRPKPVPYTCEFPINDSDRGPTYEIDREKLRFVSATTSSRRGIGETSCPLPESIVVALSSPIENMHLDYKHATLMLENAGDCLMCILAYKQQEYCFKLDCEKAKLGSPPSSFDTSWKRLKGLMITGRQLEGDLSVNFLIQFENVELPTLLVWVGTNAANMLEGMLLDIDLIKKHCTERSTNNTISITESHELSALVSRASKLSLRPSGNRETEMSSVVDDSDGQYLFRSYRSGQNIGFDMYKRVSSVLIDRSGRAVACLERGGSFQLIKSRSGWQNPDETVTDGEYYKNKVLMIANSMDFKLSHYNKQGIYIREDHSASHAEKQLALWFILRHRFLLDEIEFVDNKSSRASGDYLRHRSLGLKKRSLLLWAKAPHQTLDSARIIVSQEICTNCREFIKKLEETFDCNLEMIEAEALSTEHAVAE